MKLLIKNMVSLRCKMLVKEELKKLGLEYVVVDYVLTIRVSVIMDGTIWWIWYLMVVVIVQMMNISSPISGSLISLVDSLVVSQGFII